MESSSEPSGPNVFVSEFGGITVSGRAHSLSAWFVLASG
jgi:thiosulfate dehydrogenase [quinone] large subunit